MKGHPAPELPMGSAEAVPGPVPQLNFLLCPLFFPPLVCLICLILTFEIIMDSQGVAKIIQKDPLYPSPMSPR